MCREEKEKKFEAEMNGSIFNNQARHDMIIAQSGARLGCWGGLVPNIDPHIKLGKDSDEEEVI